MMGKDRATLAARPDQTKTDRNIDTMKKTTPKRTLAELNQLITAWEANTEFTVNKDVTLASTKAVRKSLDDCLGAITEKRTELTGLTNERNDCSTTAAQLITRIRSAFRGFYGPNSKQYEQAGGTRTDNRKTPVRKNAKAFLKAA